MGGVGSGGPNGGPQYNPANISANGGAGQSGKGTQAATYIPGQAYGQGQATMQQQQAAPMAGNPLAALQQTPVTPLGAPTEMPDQPISHGADWGVGPGTDSLNTPPMAAPQAEQPIQILQTLYMQDPTNEDVRSMLEHLSNQGRL